MTEVARAGHIDLHTHDENAGAEQPVKKASTLMNVKVFAELKFHPTQAATKQKSGLADNSNVHVAAGGYINKIRRRESSKNIKEPKKVPLVRTNSKVFFKPNAGRKHVAEKKQFTVPVPQHVVPDDHELSPMDVDSPMVKIRNLMTRKPHGVVDIDAVKDPLACSEYAQEIIDYLQMVERRYTKPKNYMCKDTEVTQHMRSMLIDWLIQVQVHQHLSQHTLHLCVNLVDHILIQHPVGQQTLQLIGITCLLLSAKYHDRFPPEITDLCYLTDDTYTPSQVLKMERFILRKMNFSLNIPEAVTFLERFLQIHQCDKKHLIESLAMYLIDLTLVDLQFVHFYPSMLSASAIYVAREVMGYDEPWNKAFVHYTKYSVSELSKCSQAMKRSLATVHKSKYTGAKVKYAHHDYHSISNHKVLLPTELWPDQQGDSTFVIPNWPPVQENNKSTLV